MAKKYDDTSRKFTDWTTQKLKDEAQSYYQTIHIIGSYGTKDLMKYDGIVNALGIRGIGVVLAGITFDGEEEEEEKSEEKTKCRHEDNCIYGELKQIDGKPCYVCECGDCHKHFLIWLDEGDNEDIDDYELFIHDEEHTHKLHDQDCKYCRIANGEKN